MSVYRIQSVRQKAFTLLELILVMILLCTVLAMAAPSLRGFFSSRQLNDISEQILIMTRYAKVQSISESKIYRINFDLNNRWYWMSSLSQSQYQRLDNSFGNYFTIPSDIDMEFEGVQSEDRIYYFQFNPQGYSSEARLRIEDNRGNILKIVCYGPAENYEIVKTTDEGEYE